MQFSNPRRSRRDLAEINVTSMIDVIFNLLIFFVLSTSFTEAGAGVVVELPSAKAADSTTGAGDFVVVMTREGVTAVDGKALSITGLAAAFDAFKTAMPTGVVVVQADAEVPHGKVVEVIDTAKAHGLPRVVIATQGG